MTNKSFDLHSKFLSNQIVLLKKKLKIMSKFSKTFVAYHGCGNCYQDGPNKIVPKNEKCIMQTYNPFWKKPMDVRN